MRRWVPQNEIVSRLEALEALQRQPTPPPLPGQTAINIGTIRHHMYEGPGPCRADLFGTPCGAHRDEHQLLPDGEG